MCFLPCAHLLLSSAMVSVSVENNTVTTLPEGHDASISLPPSLFAELDLMNITEVGIGFTFYETVALFPLPEGSPSNLTIGSSVIGALVGGQSFSDLQDPVIILLHLTSQVCMLNDYLLSFVYKYAVQQNSVSLMYVADLSAVFESESTFLIQNLNPRCVSWNFSAAGKFNSADH